MPPCRFRFTIHSVSRAGSGFLLPNGKSFFLGATGHTAIYTPSGSTANGSWIAGPDIPNASGTPDAPGAMMPNGKVLCVVSPVPTSANHYPTPSSFYEYDYTANAVTQVSAPTGGTTLNQVSFVGTMLVVPDGTVLYSNFGTQIYNYQPDGSPLVAGKPTVTSIAQNSDGSFHLVGTQLNGISEGSAYGDDNQKRHQLPNHPADLHRWNDLLGAQFQLEPDQRADGNRRGHHGVRLAGGSAGRNLLAHGHCQWHPVRSHVLHRGADCRDLASSRCCREIRLPAR